MRPSSLRCKFQNPLSETLMLESIYELFVFVLIRSNEVQKTYQKDKLELTVHSKFYRMKCGFNLLV